MARTEMHHHAPSKKGTRHILDSREAWLIFPLTVLGVLIAFALFSSAKAHDGHHEVIEETGGGRMAPVAPAEEPALAVTEAQLVKARISTRISGQTRVIEANGLPNHATGSFPNRNNPNSIRAQSYRFTVPANPQLTGRARAATGTRFGVALNGVVFDPGTAEYYGNDRNWRMEAIGGPRNLGLDHSNAHVQPSGAYHYHGIPTALVAALGGASKPVQIGWAADGFAIYSPYGWPEGKARSGWQLKTGVRSGGPGGRPDGSYTRDWEYKPGSGSLDACNGRDVNGRYVYVLTDHFPFIPRCFMGNPDNSFANAGRGGGARGGRDGQGASQSGHGNPQRGGRYGSPPGYGGSGGHPPPPPPWYR
ncbi:MAG: hypothetical protein Alpg2KO_13550 [Alphaproteobacteria bacterium]